MAVGLQLIRNSLRAKEIVTILLKYRFDELLDRIETPASFLRKITPAIKGSYTFPQRMRMAVEELGPTFIKAAQWLSTRPDILKGDWIQEFKLLRDRVKVLPFSEMRGPLEKALGNPLDEVFVDFQEEPIASGSLGQIYKARLRTTGEAVAVKVQRPGVREKILADMDIIQWFADQMHEHMEHLRPFNLPQVVDELRRGLLSELDFTNEARNATLFNAMNRLPDRVFAPEVVGEYIHPRLVVTKWVDGVSVDDVGFDIELRRKLAESGGMSFFSQVASTGFFHGDPHPGNLLVTEEGMVCLIDWGLAGQLTRNMRFNLIDLFSACAERSAEKIVRIGIRMARTTRRVRTHELEKAVTAVLFRHDESLRKMEHLGQIIFDLIYVFGSSGIQLARDYTLLAKAATSIEETARQLDPDFNLVRVGEPFVTELNWERTDPKRVLSATFAHLHSRALTLIDLPRDIQRLVHRLEDEDLSWQVFHRGLEPMGDRIDSAFSRLSLSIVIGALLVGSSIVIQAGLEPFLFGYPAIGLIGYLLSGCLGLYLAIDIIRHGRHL